MAENQAAASLPIALSEGQSAVASLSGDSHALVIGAPGTGKSTAVRALVQNLAGELGPASVLAIAANRESANLMRDQIALGFQGATPGPMARTLSSLAFSILRQAALESGFREPELISGPEQDRILKAILEPFTASGNADFGSAEFEAKNESLAELGFPKYVTAQVAALRGFRAELRDLIAVCQENQISPDDLKRLGESHDLQIWIGAAEIYRRYFEALREPAFENRHDSSTLLNMAEQYVIQLVGDSAATVTVPAVLQHLKLVAVDDAQELTPGASRFLKALAAFGIKLVLVGDPDAAVLGFRAADARGMRTLYSDLGATKAPIVLDALGDSATGAKRGLLAALSKISSKLTTDLAGPQRAANVAPAVIADEAADIDSASRESIEVRVHDNPASESAWLAHRLRQLHLHEGVAWQQIAVIGRSRDVLTSFEAELAAENIPVLLHGARSALRDEFASRELLQLLRFVLEPRELGLDEAVAFLSGPYCGLDSLALRRLRRALRRQELEGEGARTADELILELFGAPGTAVTLKTPEGFLLSDFMTNLFATRTLADEGATVDQLLWSLWSASKAKSRWLQQSRGLGEVAVQSNRNLDALVALFSAANRFVERTPEAPAIEFVEFQLDLELPEDTLSLNYRNDNRVQLMTPSALIGKEFDTIVLVGMQESIWPNLKVRSSLMRATALAEFITGRIDSPKEVSRNEIFGELRMLYKSVGAARSKVIFSAVENEELQTSQFAGLLVDEVPEPITFNEPALTLRAKVGEIRRSLHSVTDAGQRAELLQALHVLGEQGVPGARVDQWYGAKGLSSTDPLVNLDDGELVYISPSQFEKFIQCPLHWFMSSHGAREGGFEANLGTLLHKVLEEATDESEAALDKAVESKWHTLDFESEWVERSQRKKARDMVKWLATYLADKKAANIEAIAREQKIQATIGQAKISGNIDRIERSADGQIQIIDLKTGSADKFAVNAMDDNAQLALYQLAYEHGGALLIPGVVEGDRLIGASLIFPGAKVIRSQSSLASATNPALHDHWLEQVNNAVRGMAMSDGFFVANIGSHCHDEYSYGECTTFLTEAVSHAG
ncbi:MAG: ATP-dependent helicase [Actinomycetales bacterium]|nr:ATP-dependent helicase [Actinomycetales bacterium]